MKNIIKCLNTKNISDRITNFKETFSNIKIRNSFDNLDDLIIDSIIPENIIYPHNMKIVSEKEFKCSKQLIHQLAHIEYNAKSIYSDTLIRFFYQISDRHKLNEFVKDISQIAYEECEHFEMLNNRLLELGSFYGEFDIHNKLWNNCDITKNDFIGRIVIISLVQEGRGLDSGERLFNRLKSLGDERSANIIKKIIDDEVNHVRIGVKWFKILCEEKNILNQKEFFKSILNKYKISVIPPFNKKLRDEACLIEDWYL